ASAGYGVFATLRAISKGVMAQLLRNYSCSKTANASMKIFGVDFTSAPSRKKPITCAACDLQESLLTVNECLKFHSFEHFEDFLRSDGPWVAAFDFPFGQPGRLVSNLGWPQTWEGYVQAVSSMGKTLFEDTLTRYQASRSPSNKQ